MSKGSDINVGSIEEDVKNIKQYINLVLNKGYCDCNELNVISTGRYCDGSKNVACSMQNILAEREQDKKRIKELEEENMKLKAQHIFTKRNSTVEEKAKIFDVIDRTVDTFLEKEKLLWEQKFKANKMSVEEATDIVNEMYQERMKSISEDENTVNVDKLDDVKFTNLEFASVRLLREVQSLQRKLVNSIPKQKVIDKIKELKLSGGSDGKDNVENLVRELTIDILQELLEGGSK